MMVVMARRGNVMIVRGTMMVMIVVVRQCLCKGCKDCDSGSEGQDNVVVRRMNAVVVMMY